jgi:hypothetical protein
VDDRGRERQVLSVAHDVGLSLAAHDEAQVFLHLGIQGPPGNPVRVGVDLVMERVRAVAQRLDRVGDVGAAGSGRDFEDLQLGREVLRRGGDIGDSRAVLGEVVVERPAQLAVGGDVVGVDAEALGPLVARLEQAVGDLGRLVITGVEAVGRDRLVLPLAGQAELPPGPDVLLGPAGVFGCQLVPSQPPRRSAPKMPSSWAIVMRVSGLSLCTTMPKPGCHPGTS